MTTQSARIPTVFAAYDAGIATLPDELIEARQAVARLDAALADLGPPPQLATFEPTSWPRPWPSWPVPAR